jgi:ABC-type transport system involved in multi-copper enzyme maturation permease subunit
VTARFARPLNPVLARELKERMRGRRAAVVLTLYLLLLTGVLYLAYRGHAGSDTGAFEGPVATEVAAIGEAVFEWVLFFMLLLVLFLVPGLTSGAIAGERERQTLVPLQVTLLRPRSILIGKVSASIAFIVLLLVASLPLLAVAYLIGGVNIGEVAGALAAVLAVALGLACLTAALSAFLRRVQTATVLAYGLVLVMVIGTLVMYAAFSLVDRNVAQQPGEDRPGKPVLLFNPLLAVADVVGSAESEAASSPFDPMHTMIHEGENDEFVAVGAEAGPAVITAVTVNGDFVPIPPPGAIDPIDVPQPVVRRDEGTPFWVRSFGVLTLLALVAMTLGSRRLRMPAKVER